MIVSQTPLRMSFVGGERGISDEQIDERHRIRVANSARDGKLLGAGRGGFLMFFAPPATHVRIARALENLKPVTFRLDRTGTQIVFYQPVDIP